MNERRKVGRGWNTSLRVLQTCTHLAITATLHYRIAIDTISNGLIGCKRDSKWITWPFDMCYQSRHSALSLGMYRTRRSAVHPDTAHVGHAGVTRSLAHPLVHMRILLPHVWNVYLSTVQLSRSCRALKCT